MPASVQHVRVDHRRLHIAVAQEILHGADIVAGFKQVRRSPESQSSIAMIRETPSSAASSQRHRKSCDLGRVAGCSLLSCWLLGSDAGVTRMR